MTKSAQRNWVGDHKIIEKAWEIEGDLQCILIISSLHNLRHKGKTLQEKGQKSDI